MLEYLRLLLGVLRAGLCAHSDLVAEHLLLRQQLLVLSRPTRPRARLCTRDKLSWLLTRLVRRDWLRHLVLGRYPDTAADERADERGKEQQIFKYPAGMMPRRGSRWPTAFCAPTGCH